MELLPNKEEKYIFIETFGCQMNESDSERMLGILKHLNYKPTDEPHKADMVILNTCSIRDKAEQKIYSALGRLKKLKTYKPDLIIGVGGCVAQQEGEKLLRRVPHLDIVFGTHNIHHLPDLIKKLKLNKGRSALTEFSDFIEEESFAYTYEKDYAENLSRRVKAVVTVMRGCDNFCSYCIVPYVRGREMSRKSNDILQEVERLAEAGIKEITLVGQNVNSYGNKEEDISFAELLRAVCRADGIERVRFITSHPKDMSEDLIELFGEEKKLCRYIHLPVQSGSNTILKRMSRGYTREDYIGKVYKLKRFYPDIGVTTDIIVGFPGETQSDFLETMSLIQEMEYDNIFSFKYSPRPETKAAAFADQIAEQIKEERLAILQETQRDITMRKNQKMLGKVVDILVEGRSKTTEGAYDNTVNQLMGRTSCSKIVNISGGDAYLGKIVPVRIEKASANSLMGIMVKNREERINICC